MNYILKRALFWLLSVLYIAYLAGFAALIVIVVILRVPDIPIAFPLQILFSALGIFAVYFGGKYSTCRRMTKNLFLENRAVFDQTLRQISEQPIVWLVSDRNGSPNEDTVREGAFYICPENGASEAAVHAAAEAAAPLYAALGQRERADYPDYSDSSVKLCIRKRSARLWSVRVKSAGRGSAQTLYYSPDGKTRQLKEAAFFPPKELADGWFV